MYYTKDNADDISRLFQRVINKKIFFLVLLVFAMYCITVSKIGRGIYTPFKIINILEIESYRTAIRAFGIGFLMLLTLYSKPLQRLLSAKPLVLIGRTSAYVYGFHWPVILSIGCWLFEMLWGKITFEGLLCVVAVASIVFSIGFALMWNAFYTGLKAKYVAG